MELPKDAHLNEIWKALGSSIRQSPPSHDWVGKLSLFGAGLLVGVGVALLLAPLADDGDAGDEGTSAEDQGAENADEVDDGVGEHA